MKVGEVSVIGVSKYVKDGKTSYTLYGVTPFEQYMVDGGAVGMQTIREWTNRVDLSVLKPGDVIILQYAKGFKDMAVLNNVTMIQPAK